MRKPRADDVLTWTKERTFATPARPASPYDLASVPGAREAPTVFLRAAIKRATCLVSSHGGTRSAGSHRPCARSEGTAKRKPRRARDPSDLECHRTGPPGPKPGFLRSVVRPGAASRTRRSALCRRLKHPNAEVPVHPILFHDPLGRSCLAPSGGERPKAGDGAWLFRPGQKQRVWLVTRAIRPKIASPEICHRQRRSAC